MTESFNGIGTVITSDENSLIFELLSLLLKHRLSRGVFYEELDDCWQTEDSWDWLMTELFNVGGTDITVDYNSCLCEWMSWRLKHRLSRGVNNCLHRLFPVSLLWRLPISFGCGMMNEIWVCGGVVCMLFFCWWPKKGENQLFGATTAVMFEFQYHE